ncbi:comm3 [Rhynchophorus ferrugineus]|uniref:comm3 n=1 Tax=Rhynchophorus ferrugineus TaxID=354439 RepID=UPI003FCEB8F9
MLPLPSTAAAAAVAAAAAAAPPSLWDPTLLHAQQRAQLIAQQNLLARQTQAQAHSEMLLMGQLAQHNLAMFGQAAPPPLSPGGAGGAAAKAGAGGHLLAPQLLSAGHFVMLPQAPRLPLAMQPPSPYAPHLLPAPQLPLVAAPHVAMKRSYGDAFQEQTASAKRAYVPTTAAAGAAAPMYQHFFPNM